jgi:hypothetical protein
MIANALASTARYALGSNQRCSKMYRENGPSATWLQTHDGENLKLWHSEPLQKELRANA